MKTIRYPKITAIVLPILVGCSGSRTPESGELSYEFNRCVMPKIHGSFVEQELKLVSLINAFKENNDNTIRILDQFAKDAASLKEHLAPHRNLWVARLG